MQKISKDMIIADLVQIDQNIIPILMREGMHCIGCPSAQADPLIHVTTRKTFCSCFFCDFHPQMILMILVKNQTSCFRVNLT